MFLRLMRYEVIPITLLRPERRNKQGQWKYLSLGLEADIDATRRAPIKVLTKHSGSTQSSRPEELALAGFLQPQGRIDIVPLPYRTTIARRDEGKKIDTEDIIDLLSRQDRRSVMSAHVMKDSRAFWLLSICICHKTWVTRKASARNYAMAGTYKFSMTASAYSPVFALPPRSPVIV